MSHRRFRLNLGAYAVLGGAFLLGGCTKDMLTVAKDALDVVCETRPLERLTMARDALADNDLDAAVALLELSLKLDGPDREVAALLEILKAQQRTRDALERESPY
jgi:hypothetical protein